ncbi:MAG TPA: TonB-dependent receptor, partial [Flavobacterium sp.]
MRTQILFIVLFISLTCFSQNKGSVSGTITEENRLDETLPFVNIILKGTSFSTNSDEFGKFHIDAPAGDYIMQFSLMGYATIENPITIVTGNSLVKNISMSSNTVTLSDVVVQGAVSREKETALLLDQKNAAEIKQSIGAQELSRKGVSDVEEGLTKITGITKVGSRGLFVRGLEDRYNNLLVNDLAVPSNSPFKKIIPLDLFPTDIVSVIEVFKTFNPNIYGDFSGGTFNINTSTGTKSITKLSIGVGYTTENNMVDFNISEDAQSTKGFFGMTGNDRMLPSIFGEIPSQRTLTGQESLSSFNSGFNVKKITSPLNSSLGLLHSEKFKFGSQSQFTYLLSLNWDNQYTIRKGVDRTVQIGNEIIYNNNFQTTESKYNTNTSALLGTNFKTGRIDLTGTLFYLRSTSSSIRDQFGVFDNQRETPNFLIRTNQLDQSDYFTGQLAGKYFLNSSKSQFIRAAGSFSKTSYQQPDRNFFRGPRQGENEIITSYGGNNFLRQYFDIDGTFYFSGLAEYGLKFGGNEEKKHQLTLGYNANSSETSTSYRFISSASDIANFTAPLNEIQNIIDADLANEVVTFRESSNAQYKTRLNETIQAGYANVSFHFRKWEVNGGVRLEQSLRETRYKENSSFSDPFLPPLIVEKLYFLPALNLKYAITEKSNIRFAAGQTYTKPVLFEALPLTYINADGTSVSGNPYLINSDNLNGDLKFEFFRSNKEMFAIGVFGKQITNAIERSFQASAGGFATTFFNTGDAVLYGAE